LTEGIRVLASTELAPMPAFVAAAGVPADQFARLRGAFTGAAARPWFGPLAQPLLIEGFASVTEASFATLLERDREAKAAGFELPA
ncbi:MAG: hypothetical protein ACRETP_05290, partial [Steroidobacteraceae bacterium]